FGVPAIVGLRELRKRVRAGMTIAVNGDEGTVPAERSEAEAREFEAKRIARIEQRRELQGKAIQPARTVDGIQVSVMANVERVRDLDAFDLRTVDGVGLYRTEFLYLDSSHFPSEEDQYHAYPRALGPVAAGAGGGRGGWAAARASWAGPACAPPPARAAMLMRPASSPDITCL